VIEEQVAEAVAVASSRFAASIAVGDLRAAEAWLEIAFAAVVLGSRQEVDRP